MRALRRALKRWTFWATARRDEERLRAELEEHIALQTDDNLRAGLPPVEARRQAILKFGAISAVAESYRDQRGIPFFETLIQDVRLALRRLRSAPGFACATILILALGVGATTSIFTLVHAVLMKSLAVANPEELYRLGKQTQCCYHGGYSEEGEFSLVSYPLYKHLRDNTHGFAELAAFAASEQLFGVRRAQSPEPAQSFLGEYVSGNYFTMFGVRAFAGRTLKPEDDRPDAPPVAVMSYRLWQQRYGSDPSVVGSVFRFSNKPLIVVGITPPGFFGDTLRSSPPDFFIPLHNESSNGDGELNSPNIHWLDVIGRIRPGANPKAIEAEMRVELKRWLRSHWGEMTLNEQSAFPKQTLFLSPGGAGITSMRENYEHWLQVLMVFSLFVLLIVCANVANLMLVRGIERRRQTALSMALGAKVSRLMKQALVESMVLALTGGAAGLFVAFAGTRLILHFAFPQTGEMAGIPIEASPSLPVLAFALLASMLTGIGFGSAPAWMATRIDPIEALRGEGRSTLRSGSLARKTLVVVQAALSLILLVTSGLLTATLHKLENQSFGFEQNGRTVVQFSPRLAGYQPAQLTPLYNRIHDTLAAIPGVSSVALCIYSPQNGNNWGSGVWVEGHRPPGPNEEILASLNRVTPGFFKTVGIPIVKGREITGLDHAASRHVAVVNEAFARRFFRGEDPIGKHFGRDGIGSEREYEVVGVAGDARILTNDLHGSVAPFFFLPEDQHDAGSGSKDPTHYLSDIVVAAKPGVSVSASQIRHAMASVNAGLPIISIHSLREQVAGQLTQERLIAHLTSFFGILSLAVSCIGLYGITAFNAERRTKEIGVRMALGADRSGVVSLVLKGAFALIVVGLLAGLPFALLAGHLLGEQLYGTNPYNPLVICLALTALGLSALAASLIPAWRASQISPLEALRVE